MYTKTHARCIHTSNGFPYLFIAIYLFESFSLIKLDVLVRVLIYSTTNKHMDSNVLLTSAKQTILFWKLCKIVLEKKWNFYASVAADSL